MSSISKTAGRRRVTRGFLAKASGTGSLFGRIILDGAAADQEADQTAILTAALDAIPKGALPIRYLTTPAGFLRGKLPSPWVGSRGWGTTQADFDSIFVHADAAVRRLMSPALRQTAATRVSYLSIGIDLFPRGRSQPHAESLVLYDVAQDTVVARTGKSYPTSDQQDELIREPSLESHFVRVGEDRLALLVCHDLMAFSPRARANSKGIRRVVGSDLGKAGEAFGVTLALHHAHTAESAATWRQAWGSLRREYERSLEGWTTSFRYRTKDGRVPKASIDAKLASGTAGAGLDIVVCGA